MKTDFYKILGINQEADPAKIKNAYRRAAKRYHPDISPKDEEKFRKVQEAYETLSDPKKKCIYDQQALEKPASETRHYRSPYSPAIYSPFNLFDDIDKIFASFERSWSDEIFDFFGEREERQRDFSIEIILSPEEARDGCELLLKIPFWSICRRCHGTGRIRNLICGLCRGQGEEKLEKKIKIIIPSGVRNGMEIKIPLKDRELRGVDLIATLRVSSY